VATILELGYNYVPPLMGFEHKTKMLSEVPVAAALLGPVVGFGAARAVTSHYAIMVSNISSLFVAGPPVVAALGEQVTKEELGGAHIHGANGSVDEVVESEEEALAKISRFLSFLPSNAWELPPVRPSADGPQRRAPELNGIIPRNRRAVFDVRRMLALILDQDTPFFEIGGGWGKSLVTGLARLDGRAVAVLASDSAHNGGALSADACRKLSRFVRLADTFHLPVVSFVDQPGFAVGTAAEAQSTIRAGANAIAALYRSLSLHTLPYTGLFHFILGPTQHSCIPHQVLGLFLGLV
jgi:propionyl-CoA carboxylase beta chain